jgi:hypothetical protein
VNAVCGTLKQSIHFVFFMNMLVLVPNRIAKNHLLSDPRVSGNIVKQSLLCFLVPSTVKAYRYGIDPP